MTVPIDPITLSVLASALTGVAEEMGTALVRSAYSSNIKERRDCSAALFDARGQMIAQAEHIPVHLGAMPDSVAAVLERGPSPGDAFILNDPYQEDVLALILANVRTPELRRGDLRAQAAANDLAARRVEELIERWGEETLLAGFHEVLDYSERMARGVIAAIPDGNYTAEGEIEGDGVTDDDIPIRVNVSIGGDSITIDFEGSAPAVAGNVNCPRSVTHSACYFALRVLLPEDVPSNAGLYRPLTIRVPDDSVVNARPPSAVAAGNVETSQRIADTVLAALAQATDVPAQGQGTMNNVVMGGKNWTYYETIGGGQGASSLGMGPSGVHVGMSNTLNTPIEALELEFPLRVERQQLIYGSGGTGTHHGGDGIERSVRVLEAASLSLMTDRRRYRPSGAHGGGDGELGHNLVNDSEVVPKVDLELAEGDVVSIRTPGGGGWGEAARS